MNTGFLRALVLRLLCLSWRKQCIGLVKLDRRLVAGEKLMLVFWHGKYFALLPLLRNRKACVFTSQSRRGDLIRDVLERFGFSAVQLKDHGREQSLDRMRQALHQHAAAAIAVDGPLGPQHHVHQGAIQLASECGHRLVPASVASHPNFVIGSRWDQYELPLPFSRVCLVIGEPMEIPVQLLPQDMARWQSRVHDELEALGLAATAHV
ncbi:MAG: DUF374 domain-containing protein [Granulosicoccus sp.]|nr:DUF374 domain-containing protein [Granulosicoccus sp.]